MTLRLSPKVVDLVPGFSRDVSEIGHHGTGDLEVRLRTERDLRRVEPLLRLAYEAAWGLCSGVEPWSRQRDVRAGCAGARTGAGNGRRLSRAHLRLPYG